MHDGAVVVKDAKIYSAGCILPLTQNNAISSDLGTRHRAAIGMSEHSDAVVVIVSEETGDISFIEKYYQSQNVQLTEGAKAFMQEFYGISEEWHFRKGVWYEFSLFPFRNVPDEFVYDYMDSFADNQKKAVEQIAGEYVVIVGEIGYYYPARIWLGSNNKIYIGEYYGRKRYI